MSESSFETFDPAPAPSIRELLHENTCPDSTMQIQSMPANRRTGRSPQPQACMPAPSSCIPKESLCNTGAQTSCTQPAPCAQTDPCHKPECCPPKQEASCVAYRAALPYPLVNPQCRNPQYAAAMLDNMAGQFSEMSAVGFYFYNSLIASEYKEIAETFHHINMVEMHHLEIFGELAKQLGENPRLWSRRGRGGGYQYWSPAFLKYPAFPMPAPPCEASCDRQGNQTIKQLLMLAMDSEKEAIRKYMQQTTWIQDINVCDNLRRIAADEELHLEILTRLYHKL